jgi:hypothetical protein
MIGTLRLSRCKASMAIELNAKTTSGRIPISSAAKRRFRRIASRPPFVELQIAACRPVSDSPSPFDLRVHRAERVAGYRQTGRIAHTVWPEFYNPLPLKADKAQTCWYVRLVPILL